MKTGKRNWTFGEGEFDANKFLPPLFGIPISIKDSFDVEGLATTFGLMSRANSTPVESPLVKCLKNSGMIPFVKTNVPQLLMTFETNNNLWGRSLNPWNRERTVGGSSGGEAALIAVRGSPLGIGSDVGGSLRIPAEYNGVFTLKPSSKRISTTYHAYIYEDAAKCPKPLLVDRKEFLCAWVHSPDPLKIWPYG